MTNPELERKRGEFEKWACKRHRCCLPNGNSLHTLFFGRNEETGEYQQDGSKDEFDSWLSSQQSTLRRVRELAQGFLGELTPEQFPPHGLVPAGRRWDNGKSEQFVKYMLAAIEREFGGVE